MATEHLSQEIYRRASIRSIWLDVIPRSEFMGGKGLNTTTFISERSEPTSDEEDWPAEGSIAPNPPCAGCGPNASPTSACGVTWNDVNYGLTSQIYAPEKLGLRGPIICEDELIYTHQAERFLETYMHALTIRSQRSVENRLKNVFMHLVPKRICDAAYDLTPNGILDPDNTPPQHPYLQGLSAATSQLTQEMLDIDAAELNQSGATDPDSAGWIDLGPDGPIYPLLIGQEASQAIQLNNAEFRMDYRYAEPSALLKRIGATRVIKNFRHVISLQPPRFTWAGGTYTRVNQWEMVATTKGYKARIRDAWKSLAGAPYEGAMILNPWVMHQEVVRPVLSAAGITFEPKSYFGEWKLVVGGREICDDSTTYDPTKKLARHFGEYRHAIRPIFPEFGRLIIFKRCSMPNTLVTCS